MSITKWLNVGLGQKLLAILKGLREAKQNLDWKDALEMVRKYFDGELPPKEKGIVEKVLETLKLKDEVDSIENFWRKLSPATRQFVRPLKDIKGVENKWPIIEKGTEIGKLKGPWNSLIDFNARAELVVVLQALGADDELLQKNALVPETGDLMLHMGFNGKLTAGGGAQLPLGFVGVKGRASATGTAELDYYFSDDEDELLLGAVAGDLVHLASPLSAKDIAEAAAYKLKGINLVVEGNLEASMGLDMEKTWGASYDVKSNDLNLDSTVDLGASLKVGYQAGLNLEGKWDVMVKPMGGESGKVKVKLFRRAYSKKSSTFSLDASLDISGLDTVGDALIKKYAPDPNGLIANLEKYANVGQVLRDELKDKLNDLLGAGDGGNQKVNDLKELANTLVGVSDEQQLSQKIMGTIQTTAEEKIDLLEGKATDAADALLDNVAEKLGLSDTLKTEFIKLAKPKITEIIDGIKAKVLETMKDLLGKAKTESDKLKLLKPLADLGENIDKIAKEADNLSQKVIQPVIRLLTKYRDIRAKVSKAVESAARLKVGLSLAHSVASTSESTALLEFEIDTVAGGEEAELYFRKMMVGHFGQLLGQLRKGDVKGIELTGGTLKEHVNRTVSTDVTLNLFGFELISKTILSADVQASCDVAGNVLVATSKSDFTRLVSAFGETRMVQFVNMMEIAGAAIDKTDKKKIFTTGLTLSYQDEDLTKKEVNQFFGSLEDAKIIAAGSKEKVVTRLEEISGDKEHKLKRTNIGLSMPMTADDLKKLIKQPQVTIENLAVLRQMDIYLTGKGEYQEFRNVIEKWGVPSPNFVEKLKELGTMNLIDAAGLDSTSSRYYPVAPIPAKDRYYIVMGGHIGRRALSLWKIVQDIKNVADYTFSKDPAELNRDIKKVNQYNRDVNKRLKEWLKVKGWVSGLFCERVPRTTLAFMVIMAQLAGIDLQVNPLIPVIKWTFADGAQQEDLIV